MKIFLTGLLILSIIERIVYTVNIREEKDIGHIMIFNMLGIIANVVGIVLMWVLP